MSVDDYGLEVIRKSADIINDKKDYILKTEGPDRYYIQKLYQPSSNLIYYGRAPNGSLTSDEVWQIWRAYRIGFEWTYDNASNGATNLIWDNVTTYFTAPAFNNVYSTLLDGSNDYVNMGNVFNYDIANQWSISGWFWQDNLSSRMNLWSKVTNDANVYGTSVAVEPTTGNFFLQVRTPSTLRSHTGSTLVVVPQQWNHFVMTYNGGSNMNGYRLYLNNSLGNIPTSASLADTLLFGQNFIFGNRNTAFPFSGYLDSWSIWSKALSAAEVSEIHDDILSPDQHTFSGDLVSWYEFGDGDVNGTIYDNHGSNDGVMVNFSYDATSGFQEFVR